MSDETARLHLSQLVSLQELNAITWNEALVQLDALVDLYLLGQFVNTPPPSPQDGDVYLIGGAPTGAWAGYPYKLAAGLDGSWRIAMPFNGLRAYVAPTGAFLIYLNGVWANCSSLISAGEQSIASAPTCDLGAANALFVQVTGNTPITSFGSAANKLRFVRFAQSLTLSHNAGSLALLGGANRTVAAGDLGLYASDGSGNWRERQYWRAAVDPGDCVTRSGTETLANKTLAAPVLSSPTVAGTMAGMLDMQNAYVGALLYMIRSNSYPRWSFTNVGNPTSRISLLATDGAGASAFYIDPIGLTYFGYGPLVIGATSAVPGCKLDVNGAIFPHTDNTNALGASSYRWSVVYAGTGTINTSGGDAKTGIRPLDQAEIAVARALARNVRIFQFADAVEHKGDAARLHAGMIFEEVVAAFLAEGLDPMRYGIVCRDRALKTVEKTRPVQRQKTQTVTERTERVVVEDGRAVLCIGEETRDAPMFASLAVVDDVGRPVLNPDGSARTVEAPVLETVDEHYSEDEPDLDAAGQPKWILGLRYSELTAFIIAGLAAS